HRAVAHQHDEVGRAHGDLGLLRDGAVHSLGVLLPATGVLHHEGAAVPQRLVGDPVARDARDVLDDGLPAADDAVHQGGLPDVGSADDRDGGQDLHALGHGPDLVGELRGDRLPVGVVVPAVLDGLLAGPGGQVEVGAVLVGGHSAFPSAVAPCDAWIV